MIYKIFRKLKINKKINAVEWAEKNLYLPSDITPIAGYYKCNNAEYQREPLEILSRKGSEEVVLMWSSQVGKGVVAMIIKMYYAKYRPLPQIFMQPTKLLIQQYWQEKITPILNKCPDIASVFIKDNLLFKVFAGGFLSLIGANSLSDLSSKSVAILIIDEIDRCLATTTEGNPLDLAMQRTAVFERIRKVLKISTPVDKNTSRIFKDFKDSNQKYFFVPCPECKKEFKIIWDLVKWNKKEDGEPDLYKEVKNKLTLDINSVYIECPHCQFKINENNKNKMVKKGKWKASKKHWRQGYHINAMYSPSISLVELVKEFTLAIKDRKKNPSSDKLKAFINLKLGEPYQEKKELTQVSELLDRRVQYQAELPDEVIILTAGVDVQHDRLELEILGHGKNGIEIGIKFIQLIGNPTNPSNPDDNKVWQQLDEILESDFKFKSGFKIKISAVSIDSSDGTTQSVVYDYCRKRKVKNIMAIKGFKNDAFVSRPQFNSEKKIELWHVGTDEGKKQIFDRLAIKDPSEYGYCMFPSNENAGYTENYFKGLVSERLEYLIKSGVKKAYYKVIYKRNEPLDCRNYARHAFYAKNLELKVKKYGTAQAIGTTAKKTVSRTRQVRIIR